MTVSGSPTRPLQRREREGERARVSGLVVLLIRVGDLGGVVWQRCGGKKRKDKKDTTRPIDKNLNQQKTTTITPPPPPNNEYKKRNKQIQI